MDEFRDKRHLVMFKTVSGEVYIGTNDLSELSEQEWFREFMNLRVARYQERPVERPVQSAQPRGAPQQQRQGIPPRRPPVQPAFVEYDPNAMTEEIWGQMNEQQRKEWMSFYGISA